MAFTITGTLHDLDGDALPGVRVQVTSRLRWSADAHGVTVGPAQTTSDEAGAIPPGWLIHADEGHPLWLSVPGLPTAAFDAPADGESVDVADLLAANVARPLPSSSPLVKGDPGKDGKDGTTVTLSTPAPGVVRITTTGA